MEVNKISLEDSTVPGPTSSGTLNIVYYPQRLRKGGGPPSLTPIKIKTAVQVDADSKIVSCQPEDGTGQGCSAADWKKRIPSSIDLSAACGSSHTPGIPLNSVTMEVAMADGGTKIYDLMTDEVPRIRSMETVWGNITWRKQTQGHLGKHAFTVSYAYKSPYISQCVNGKWMYMSIDDPPDKSQLFSRSVESGGTPLPNAAVDPVVYAIKYQTGGEPRTPTTPCPKPDDGGTPFHDSGGPGGSSGSGAGY